MKKLLSLSLFFVASSISLTACNSLLFKEVSYSEFTEEVQKCEAKDPTKVSFKYKIKADGTDASGSFVISESTDPDSLSETDTAALLVYALASSIDNQTAAENDQAKYYTNVDGSFKITFENENGKGNLTWDKYLNCTKLYTSASDGTLIDISVKLSY